jgi:ferredoxin
MVTSRDEMPADPSEIAEGHEEGVRLVNRRGPKEILGRDGKVIALRTQKVARVFDDAGRFAPQFVDGEDEELACDTVVLAVGQMADLSFLGDAHGLELTAQGLIAVDGATLATSRANVFAGGDVAFGPRIVISAVADGRRAARGIDTLITGRRDEPPRVRLRVFPTFGYEHPFARGDYETVPRAQLPVIPVERRAGGAEVERVLDENEARKEGQRCLHCWVNTNFDSSKLEGSECIQCGGCVDVCPEQCLMLVPQRRFDAGSIESGIPLGTASREAPRLAPLASPIESGIPLGTASREAPRLAPLASPIESPIGAAILKDETACIRCGLCARRCPTSVITMQAHYREDEAALVSLAEGSL